MDPKQAPDSVSPDNAEAVPRIRASAGFSRRSLLAGMPAVALRAQQRPPNLIGDRGGRSRLERCRMLRTSRDSNASS